MELSSVYTNQSLIKGSLSTRPNTDRHICSWHNFHYTKIVALIEGEDWNAIGMPADQRVTTVNTSTHTKKNTPPSGARL